MPSQLIGKRKTKSEKVRGERRLFLAVGYLHSSDPVTISDKNSSTIFLLYLWDSHYLHTLLGRFKKKDKSFTSHNLSPYIPDAKSFL